MVRDSVRTYHLDVEGGAACFLFFASNHLKFPLTSSAAGRQNWVIRCHPCLSMIVCAEKHAAIEDLCFSPWRAMGWRYYACK